MKDVRIADLKAHLSEHLREVKRGESLVVLDRDTPIARIIPFDVRPAPFVIRPRDPKSPPLGEIEIPHAPEIDVDIVELLMEERQNQR
ncbi:MAG TPA: type II toxin-antitoxin system prevent-host-death family antitoxin [Thermoanaerobaculia bacterium]|nr:type II toxin-antitoxin system prevent-host-death family antitoxin [Thermoanaerobaculia bacterium]